MASRWNRGIFLGICRMTGRYLIWDDGAATAARTIVRLPDVQKWDKDKVAAVISRPWQLHERKEPVVQFREPTEGAVQEQVPEQTRETRRLYIKRADVEAYGYTQGCPKCDHDLQFGFGRTTKGHSDSCRKRISVELMKKCSGPLADSRRYWKDG